MVTKIRDVVRCMNPAAAPAAARAARIAYAAALEADLWRRMGHTPLTFRALEETGWSVFGACKLPEPLMQKLGEALNKSELLDRG